jgi:transcription initiation factor TFIIIB Brf1 subunit/transcription initiation factor TFIIB
MSIEKCSDCGSEQFLEDYARGEIRCAKCGLVISENIPYIESKDYEIDKRKWKTHEEIKTIEILKEFEKICNLINIFGFWKFILEYQFRIVYKSIRKHITGRGRSRKNIVLYIVHNLLWKFYYFSSMGILEGDIDTHKTIQSFIENLYRNYPNIVDIVTKNENYLVKRLNNVIRRRHEEVDNSIKNFDIHNASILFTNPFEDIKNSSLDLMKDYLLDIALLARYRFDKYLEYIGKHSVKKTGLFCACLFVSSQTKAVETFLLNPYSKNMKNQLIYPKNKRLWAKYFKISPDILKNRMAEIRRWDKTIDKINSHLKSIKQP